MERPFSADVKHLKRADRLTGWTGFLYHLQDLLISTAG